MGVRHGPLPSCEHPRGAAGTWQVGSQSRAALGWGWAGSGSEHPWFCGSRDLLGDEGMYLGKKGGQDRTPVSFECTTQLLPPPSKDTPRKATT